MSMGPILKQHVKDFLVQKYEGRAPRNRIAKVHASDVYDFCARRLALATKTDTQIITSTRQRNFGDYLTFELGTYIQSLITESLVSKVIAHWECLSCKRDWYGIRPPQCECGSTWFKYHESGYEIPAGKVTIVGHVDLFYLLPNGKIIPVECKSIDGDRFDKLLEPTVENEIQLQTYLWGLRHKKAKIPEWLKRYKIDWLQGRILYVSKAYRYDPLREFVVTLSDTHSRNMGNIEKSLIDFSKKGTVPPRICNTELFPMARKCSLAAECFKGKPKRGK